ncbi:hypothetical protein MCUN1_002419 [Malassezia cuniculi]|uniref:Oxidoreductase-like domain-containing protein n=1 Tax=Malassezia cuniculi TaxID=948313 RepID=A0AAF0J6U0_9BASI|nr:hypothetical protein MCUN1_002419 [Malassezia cuniculi]
MRGGSWQFLSELKSRRSVRREENEKPAPSEGGEPSAITVRGISVPVRPQPPGPEDCCMSGASLLTGCINCVHVLYTDELQEYREQMKPIREQLLALKPPVRPDEWDERLGVMPGSDEPEAPEDDGLDPSTRAFLELERKLNNNSKSS